MSLTTVLSSWHYFLSMRFSYNTYLRFSATNRIHHTACSECALQAFCVCLRKRPLILCLARRRYISACLSRIDKSPGPKEAEKTLQVPALGRHNGNKKHRQQGSNEDSRIRSWQSRMSAMPVSKAIFMSMVGTQEARTRRRAYVEGAGAGVGEPGAARPGGVPLLRLMWRGQVLAWESLALPGQAGFPFSGLCGRGRCWCGRAWRCPARRGSPSPAYVEGAGAGVGEPGAARAGRVPLLRLLRRAQVPRRGKRERETEAKAVVPHRGPSHTNHPSHPSHASECRL